jgi:hypothetical protein
MHVKATFGSIAQKVPTFSLFYPPPPVSPPSHSLSSSPPLIHGRGPHVGARIRRLRPLGGVPPCGGLPRRRIGDLRGRAAPPLLCAVCGGGPRTRSGGGSPSSPPPVARSAGSGAARQGTAARCGPCAGGSSGPSGEEAEDGRSRGVVRRSRSRGASSAGSRGGGRVDSLMAQGPVDGGRKVAPRPTGRGTRSPAQRHSSSPAAVGSSRPRSSPHRRSRSDSPCGGGAPSSPLWLSAAPDLISLRRLPLRWRGEPTAGREVVQRGA